VGVGGGVAGHATLLVYPGSGSSKIDRRGLGRHTPNPDPLPQGERE
jgi:hypothetical protein